MTPAKQAEELVGRLVEKFGPGVLASSCAGGRFGEKASAPLWEMMGSRVFERVVEIGTLRGVSACVLACFAETVITIDVREQPERDEVLAAAGVRERVVPVVVPSDAAKRRFIDSLTFDLAVVDGNHFREPVKFDFECVRRCGLVLFHDYPASGTDADGVGYLLDEIRPAGIIERCPPFAWWRA